MSLGSGYIVAGRHLFPVRVYYEDTDAGGIVYHARYIAFAERARTELLRSLGLQQSALRDSHDLVFAVKDCAADFRRPARLDDELEVVSTLRELKGASFRVGQEIRRAAACLVSLDFRIARRQYRRAASAPT